jgi:hypothetical protein
VIVEIGILAGQSLKTFFNRRNFDFWRLREFPRFSAIGRFARLLL